MNSDDTKDDLNIIASQIAHEMKNDDIPENDLATNNNQEHLTVNEESNETGKSDKPDLTLSMAGDGTFHTESCQIQDLNEEPVITMNTYDYSLPDNFQTTYSPSNFDTQYAMPVQATNATNAPQPQGNYGVYYTYYQQVPYDISNQNYDPTVYTQHPVYQCYAPVSVNYSNSPDTAACEYTPYTEIDTNTGNIDWPATAASDSVPPNISPGSGGEISPREDIESIAFLQKPHGVFQANTTDHYQDVHPYVSYDVCDTNNVYSTSVSEISHETDSFESLESNGIATNTVENLNQTSDETIFPAKSCNQSLGDVTNNVTYTNYPIYQTISPSPHGHDFNLTLSKQYTSSQSYSNFMYPAIYVSNSGLITILLKHDVSVEMTVDQAIRLVSHQKNFILATNSRGSANFLSHPAAKIVQDSTTTEAEIFSDRKVKMTTETITFGDSKNCYTFDYQTINKGDISDFSKLAKDSSITYLFSSVQLGKEVNPQCLKIISEAQHKNIKYGGFLIRINGTKVVQTGRGEVSVVCGPKFLKLSPTSDFLELQTHFINMAVDSNWNINVRRGSHHLDVEEFQFKVSNGRVEAGFDGERNVYAYLLPRRIPIDIGEETQHSETNNAR